MSDTNDAATQATAVPSHTGEDAQNDVLLDVQHLTKRFAAETNFFGRATSHVQAVDDVSFQIRRGEAFGLVGESGCGKTTVGKMLVNLIKPTSGTIVFDGHDLTAMKNKERKRYCRDIQLIFQDPYASLNPRMRVGDIIAEPILTNKLLPKDQVEDRVNELLECVGLANYMRNRYPHEFSGGQRQRVGIARALAVKPKLIVCDEPVSALDVSIQAQVLNLLDELKEQFGLTYLYIAHGLRRVGVPDRSGNQAQIRIDSAEAIQKFAEHVARLVAFFHVRPGLAYAADDDFLVLINGRDHLGFLGGRLTHR